MDLALWYDLSPMRPDEFARTVAWRWLDAVALRRGYQDGINDAREEEGMRTRLNAMGHQA